MKHWKATVSYKHENGIKDVSFELDELDELHTIVERGPAWWTIAHIHMSYLGPIPANATRGTVEEALTL